MNDEFRSSLIDRFFSVSSVSSCSILVFFLFVSFGAFLRLCFVFFLVVISLPGALKRASPGGSG
jgi:hypothetical protein